MNRKTVSQQTTLDVSGAHLRMSVNLNEMIISQTNHLVSLHYFWFGKHNFSVVLHFTNATLAREMGEKKTIQKRDTNQNKAK